MKKKKYNTIEEDTTLVTMVKELYSRYKVQPLLFVLEVLTVVALFGFVYGALWLGGILGL